MSFRTWLEVFLAKNGVDEPSLIAGVIIDKLLFEIEEHLYKGGER